MCPMSAVVKVGESKLFSELSIGDWFELSKDPISTVQLVMYAGASGDFNRIHYDLPFAQEAGLGGVIGHGMLTMGFLGQLVMQWAGPKSHVVELSARFLKPVRPGDVCILSGKVTEKAADSSTVLCELEGHTASGSVIAGNARLQLAR